MVGIILMVLQGGNKSFIIDFTTSLILTGSPMILQWDKTVAKIQIHTRGLVIMVTLVFVILGVALF